MTALDLSSPVAVVGTGTMGPGHRPGRAGRRPSRTAVRRRPGPRRGGGGRDRRPPRPVVEKDRLSGAERDAARDRLLPAETLAELADCSLVVEAVLERLDVKQQLFRELEDVVGDDCLLATNTSSLSVTAVGGALRNEGRFVGLHFFNPAPLLPLVEVVSGFATDVTSATHAYETARAWARPRGLRGHPRLHRQPHPPAFYAEAFAVLEAQAADPATIDAVLRESGGFRMGAFELTDLIGQDVNESVTRSVWESFFQDVRFTPSLAQRRLVESGRLGRKSGQGWYDYADDAERSEPHTAERAQPPAYVVAEGDLGPASELLALIREAGIGVRRTTRTTAPVLCCRARGQLALADGQTSVEFRDVVYFDLALDYRKATRIALSASQDTSHGTLAEAIGLFQALGKDVSVIGDVPGMIVARTVARIVDLAHDAVAKGVATEEDIDTAMRLGVNYPLGPFEWSRRLGRSWAYDLLDDLHMRDPSGRYAPSLALYRHAYASEKREGTP